MANLDFELPPGFGDIEFTVVETDSALSESLRKSATGGSLDFDEIGARRVVPALPISWNKPPYEFGDGEDRKVRVEEVKVTEGVVAVRGIIVKPSFGLAFKVDGEGEGEMVKTVCRTTSAIFFDGKHTAQQLDSSHPLRMPQYQPHDSKTTPERMHTPGKSLVNGPLLMGSRGKYCIQCVQDGDHYKGNFVPDANGNLVFEKTGKVCGHEGDLLFCVFEIGRMVEVPRRIGGKSVQVPELHWTKVHEWTREAIDDQGELGQEQRYKRPFMIRLSVPKTHVIARPETERFRVDFSVTPYIDTTTTTLYGAEQYLQYLSRQDVSAVVSFQDGSLNYAQMTDIYFVKPTPATTENFKGSKAVSVFTPTEGVTNDESLRNCMLARSFYLHERSLYGSKPESTPEELPSFQKPVFGPSSKPRQLEAHSVRAEVVDDSQLRSAATLPPAASNESKTEKVNQYLGNLLS